MEESQNLPEQGSSPIRPARGFNSELATEDTEKAESTPRHPLHPKQASLDEFACNRYHGSLSLL